MKRKGLSQILFLIIAASVLMMIAMVITFTATDIIGGAGGQATDNSCLRAIEGKCLTTSSESVKIPTSTCVKEEQFVGGVTAYQTSSVSTTATYSASSSTDYWADCSDY